MARFTESQLRNLIRNIISEAPMRYSHDASKVDWKHDVSDIALDVAENSISMEAGADEVMDLCQRIGCDVDPALAYFENEVNDFVGRMAEHAPPTEGPVDGPYIRRVDEDMGPMRRGRPSYGGWDITRDVALHAKQLAAAVAGGQMSADDAVGEIMRTCAEEMCDPDEGIGFLDDEIAEAGRGMLGEEDDVY